MDNDYVAECEEAIDYWLTLAGKYKADPALGEQSESYRTAWATWQRWEARLEGAHRALAAQEDAWVRAAEQEQDARGEGLVRY